MTSYHGQFVWYDLMTTDVPAAKQFYTAVIGWATQETDSANGRYTMLKAGDVGVGGMMALSRVACDAGARPGWIGYIAVDSVDAYCSKVQQAGGSVIAETQEIPGIGQFAVVADPHRAAFILFTPYPGEMPPAQPPMTPGLFSWHELHAGQREAAFAFYAGLFGWSPVNAMDMGPMGVYQTFATQGTEMVGGMMTKTTQMPVPFWLYYINVEDIHAAIGRVTDHGGQVINGPMQVPGGGWIAQGVDPQGAMFALVAPK